MSKKNFESFNKHKHIKNELFFKLLKVQSVFRCYFYKNKPENQKKITSETFYL